MNKFDSLTSLPGMTKRELEFMRVDHLIGRVRYDKYQAFAHFGCAKRAASIQSDVSAIVYFKREMRTGKGART